MNRAEKIERLQNILKEINRVEKNIIRYEGMILSFNNSPFPSDTTTLNKNLSGLSELLNVNKGLFDQTLLEIKPFNEKSPMINALNQADESRTSS